MRTNISMLIITLGLVFAFALQAADTPANNFTFTDMNGQERELSSFKGKVVILDFWATWCKPCVREIPTLLDIYKNYNKEGLEIIGVSLDSNMSKTRNFVKANKMNWIHILDKEANTKLAKMYKVMYIPDMFIINKEGKIVARGLRGESLKEAIKKLVQ